MANDNLVDTDTEVEHDTVNYNEELEKNTGKNITNVDYETKQDDEVLDNICIDAAEEADT